MLISHRYKFIFIKVKKTAGTSIEISLSRFLDHPDDVITQTGDTDDALRLRETGVTPRNFMGDVPAMPHFDRPLKWWNHCPASFIRSQIPPEQWNGYFKFCFERNPWDKVVSMFWTDRAWNRIPPDMEFPDYVPFRASLTKDWETYTENGEFLVDQVGRYETLTQDLDAICRQLGVPFDGWLPRAKGDLRQDKRHYREYYTDRTRDIVADLFAQETAIFGYTFDG